MCKCNKTHAGPRTTLKKLTDILCVASDVSAAMHIIAHVNEDVQDSAKTKFPHRFNLTSSHFIIHCSE